MSKFTEWFNAKVTPVHQGVYRINLLGPGRKAWYRYWDGKDWRYGSTTPSGAYSSRNGAVQTPHTWRGLARKPK